MRPSLVGGRWAACVLAVLVCATLAVSCGRRVPEAGAPSVSTSSPATIPVTHSRTSRPSGTVPKSCSSRHPCGPVVPAGQIDASAMPYRKSPTTWTEDGGRTVALAFTRGVCETLHGQRVSVSRTEARIRVVDTDTSHGKPCTLQGVLDTVRVRLPHPLGDRTVVLSWREESR